MMDVPPPADLATRLDVARAIAREAGDILCEGWGQRPRFRTKATAIDLVTEFDERSESLVVTRLRDRYPDDHIVGEEGARVAGRAGAPTWYIDPLDGTANFTHGVPMFAVSIGLVDETGRPLLGVVHAPALDWCFAGAPGLGAFRNQDAIQVSQVSELPAAMLATGFPSRPNLPHDNFAEFAALTGHVHGTRRQGSAALDLAFVACGWYDGFWERHIQPWDLIGGAALVLAAGGQVSDLDGGRFDGETGRALASNGHLHDALGTVLQKVAREQGTPWPG